MLLFGVFLVLMIGSGFYVLTTLYPPAVLGTGYGWAFVLEALLSLLLLLVAGTASRMLQAPIARTILSLTSIAALVSGAAFLGIGSEDLSRLLTQFLAPTDPNQLLSLVFTIGLGAAAIISLFWVARPFTRVDRIILAIPFGISLVCTLIQLAIPLPPFYGASATQKHILLLVALIALIQGTVLAAQMERERGNAKA
jgi:hypothetical protein